MYYSSCFPVHSSFHFAAQPHVEDKRWVYSESPTCQLLMNHCPSPNLPLCLLLCDAGLGLCRPHLCLASESWAALRGAMAEPARRQEEEGGKGPLLWASPSCRRVPCRSGAAGASGLLSSQHSCNQLHHSRSEWPAHGRDPAEFGPQHQLSCTPTSGCRFSSAGPLNV